MNGSRHPGFIRAGRRLALCFALLSLLWLLCACSSAKKAEPSDAATLPAGIFPDGTSEVMVPDTDAPTTEPATDAPTDPPATETPAPTEPAGPPVWQTDPGSVTDLDAELPGFDYSPYLPVPEDVSRGDASLSYLYTHGGISRAGGDKTVALSFVLVGENGLTGQLLDILQEKQVPATFLITLRNYLNSSPADAAETVRRIVREGHLVSAHGYTFTHTSLATNRRFLNEQVLYQAELDNLLRYHYPVSVFSAPYAAVCERDVYLCDLTGFRFLSYSCLLSDAENEAPVYMVLPKLKEALSPGCIIQLRITESTVKATADFIEYAQQQGYQFVLPVHVPE